MPSVHCHKFGNVLKYYCILHVQKQDAVKRIEGTGVYIGKGGNQL